MYYYYLLSYIVIYKCIVTLRKSSKPSKGIPEKTLSTEDLSDVRKSSANVGRHSCDIATLSAPNPGNDPLTTPEMLRRGKLQSKMTKSYTFNVNSPFPDNSQEKQATNAVFEFPEVGTDVDGLSINQVKTSLTSSDEASPDIKRETFTPEERIDKNLILCHNREGK